MCMILFSDRTNIVVIADEAHQSQYGFKREVETEEGSEIRYGNAKYLEMLYQTPLTLVSQEHLLKRRQIYSRRFWKIY